MLFDDLRYEHVPEGVAADLLLPYTQLPAVSFESLVEAGTIKVRVTFPVGEEEVFWLLLLLLDPFVHLGKHILIHSSPPGLSSLTVLNSDLTFLLTVEGDVFDTEAK